MITVLDFEAAVTRSGKKIDGSPYNPANFLVSYGYARVVGNVVRDPVYRFLEHRDGVQDRTEAAQHLQNVLDTTTLLVAHNAKFELQWLREAGFTYNGPVWCTMIAEYVLQRSIKEPLDLASVALKYGGTPKQKDLIAEMFQQGTGFEAMPQDVVTEYGIADVLACADVYLAQTKLYDEEFPYLIPTRDMSFEFCDVLTEMERNGIAIDLAALDEVEQEYVAEKERLETRLREIVVEVMGDTPISLSSPEQLSMLIYSRKVNDKHTWARVFNLGKDERGKDLRRPNLNKSEFVKAVRANTTPIRRTRAEQCSECRGSGKQVLYTKAGTLHKRPPKCDRCGGVGIVYTELGQYAGLMLSPSSIEDVTANGFATNKETLDALILVAEKKNNHVAAEFLRAVSRLNAVDTYLSSFVGGIRNNVRPDRLLHAKFNQCVTSTGRLSSTDP